MMTDEEWMSEWLVRRIEDALRVFKVDPEFGFSGQQRRIKEAK